MTKCLLSNEQERLGALPAQYEVSLNLTRMKKKNHDSAVSIVTKLRDGQPTEFASAQRSDGLQSIWTNTGFKLARRPFSI